MPAYTVPSGPTAGEAPNTALVLSADTFHTVAPVAVDSATSLDEANTYSKPVPLSAGEPLIVVVPPLLTFHITLPLLHKPYTFTPDNPTTVT